MNTLEDTAAEAIVAACCVDSPHAARLAHGRLKAGDFAHHGFADLFACSLDLPDQPPDHNTDPHGLMLHQIRAQAAAERCGIRLAAIQEAMRLRPVMSDDAGTYAGRVLAAARVRRIASGVEDARLNIAAGVDIDDIVGELRRLLEAA